MLHACSSCAKLKNLHGRTPESDGPFACSICGKRSADVALWSRFGMEKALSIFLSVLVIITVFSLVIWSMYSVAAENIEIEMKHSGDKPQFQMFLLLNK
jgi:hypothetical protein